MPSIAFRVSDSDKEQNKSLLASYVDDYKDTCFVMQEASTNTWKYMNGPCDMEGLNVVKTDMPWAEIISESDK